MIAAWWPSGRSRPAVDLHVGRQNNMMRMASLVIVITLTPGVTLAHSADAIPKAAAAIYGSSFIISLLLLIPFYWNGIRENWFKIFEVMLVSLGVAVVIAIPLGLTTFTWFYEMFGG
jgi:hypothetical protein